MKKRRLSIILTLVIAAMVLGTATFFRVQYLTLMCNVSHEEANRVAFLATFLTVAGFVFGGSMVWLGYHYGHFQHDTERRINIGVLCGMIVVLMGTVAFFGVRFSVQACTREYVEVAKFPKVINVATIFATLSCGLGEISILLGHHYGIFKKD